MTTLRAIRIRGRVRYVLVTTRRSLRRLGQMARRMRAKGWPWCAIASACGVRRDRVESLVDVHPIWGVHAGAFRRAA